MYSITVSCKNLHSNKVSKLKKDVLSCEYISSKLRVSSPHFVRNGTSVYNSFITITIILVTWYYGVFSIITIGVYYSSYHP